MIFTTSLGDAYPYIISAITTDAAGNTYVVGSRVLGGSLTAGIGNFSPTPTTAFLYAPSDVFVSKLDPNDNLLFTDTFAGKGVDQGIAIALDPSGNIYIGGTTTSNDFPLSKAIQTQPSPYGAGFIIKLSNDGSTILYSTYFGGVLGGTRVNAMTTDASGNLYLTGTTFASDFPHTTGMPSAGVIEVEGTDQTIAAAFVAALDAAGDKVLFAGAVAGSSTVCSGGFHDCQSTAPVSVGVAIALDASRNVYFGGNTNTTDMPATSGAFLKQGMGAFAGKIASGGTGLAYLTYLGAASELAQRTPPERREPSLFADRGQRRQRLSRRKHRRPELSRDPRRLSNSVRRRPCGSVRHSCQHRRIRRQAETGRQRAAVGHVSRRLR